eukprot:TRINITY_DN2106_c0_g1_i1.p1 TRINITY_DN2106_c0_g1~~TRINITY_DN2106_c0_g1_i1.p1  ORF type:complete len:229 (-),score=43.96 TRINITY_DN2106_c0_g1_i1:93-701(-)
MQIPCAVPPWSLLVLGLMLIALPSISAHKDSDDVACIPTREILERLVAQHSTARDRSGVSAAELPPEPWTIEIVANNFTIELGVMNKTLNVSSVDHEVLVTADCPQGINGFVDVDSFLFDAYIRLDHYKVNGSEWLVAGGILVAQLVIAVVLFYLHKRIRKARQFYHFGHGNKGHLCGCGTWNMEGSFCYRCGQPVHRHVYE